jgi:hypothetical protein
MTYVWNRSRSIDADVVGFAVERIADEHGGVCPSWAMVDVARPEESELHPLFEWDDFAAAESFRREQARHHIRELRVVVDSEEEPVQAFVHIVRASDDGPVEGYRATRFVVQSVDECKQMLDEAMSGLRAWQRRYRHLNELTEVFQVIARIG